MCPDGAPQHDGEEMRSLFIYCVCVLLSALNLFGVLTPNEFKGKTDSDRIEAAIAEAVRTGERSIEIPRMNAATEKPLWLIDRAILVPSDFTLILRACTVRLSPGTQDNLIRNAGTASEPMKKDQNIHILGIGNPLLSGGLKAHFDPPGDKSGWRTIGILLCDVQYFTIDGITLEETQAWGVSVENGCCNGRISNMAFRDSNKMPNQDGVDVRKGCHDIIIENITGAVGDDAVALTGLRNDKASRNPGTRTMQVGGNYPRANDDIYNIIIRNVQAKCTGGHGIVRLLNHDGVRMYNIVVRDVIDISSGKEPRVQAAIRIGDTNYSSMRKSQMGEMFNITVDTVMTRGRIAVLIKGPLKDSVIRNIKGFDGCTNLVQKNAPVENVLIEN